MLRAIWIVAIVSLLLGLWITPVIASDPSAVREHLSGVMTSAEEMVVHLQEGHVGVFMKHAGDFIRHAKAAIEAIPGNERGEEVAGHLKMAIAEGEDALESAESGRADLAENHALSALSHAGEADSLADGL